ncbi:uncharacterized RNA-binding protein C1827.05c [Sipha flava]|uniref:Uncharacterized RNA-binding protein C1827.05c n=1 Tax=Sipha flava TaxID=143950 RepID=A0A8B8G7T6_9HEMI|nr:uncharacterized RNA-binding protein C1827.05c [Sipha flava]
MFRSGFIKLNKKEQPEEKKPKASDERGVVYLGHVPHGFYENEMKLYFSQFGEVTNINIPKSKKTGKARGFAFVEFKYPEVAKVVAETMNNYLMHKKILVAKYLPPNQVKSNTFWRSDKKNIPLTAKNRSIQRKAMEIPLDFEKQKKIKSSLEKRVLSKQKKFKSKGIEYEIQIYKSNPSINIDDSKQIESASEFEDNNDNITCSEPNSDMDNTLISIPEITKKTKVKKGKGRQLRINS